MTSKNGGDIGFKVFPENQYGNITTGTVYRKYEYDNLSRITHEYVAMGKSDKNRFYINQYLYDSDKISAEIRICQNSSFDEKFTKYKYNQDDQIQEISDYGDGTIYKFRYE